MDARVVGRRGRARAGRLITEACRDTSLSFAPSTSAAAPSGWKTCGDTFESFGFREVETFIASGNVVFETRSKDARRLEKRIEEGLREALGFEVATFLRTEDELAALADRQPFSQKELDAGVALNVAFLKETLDEESTGKLMKLRTEIDDFSVRGREVFWLCRKRQGESAFSNTVFEKAVGRRATFRGLNTVRRMAAKYLSHNS